MKSVPKAALPLIVALVAGCAQAPVAPAAAAVDTGLTEIAELGRINGTALACQDSGTARRAKALMLTHAPKTARYGSSFDDATQQAYLDVTGSRVACPNGAAAAGRLDAVAQRLQVVLPAAAGAAASSP